MKKRLLLTLLTIVITSFSLFGTEVKGTITDAKTGKPIAYAIVMAEGSNTGATTNELGEYSFNIIAHAYRFIVSFFGYQTQYIEVDLTGKEEFELNVALELSVAAIKGVTVTAQRNKATEESVIMDVKKAQTVASGVSSATIEKTQDGDAAEVVKRIPGVTLMDGRFIIIRGLTERYNNTWLNHGVTPSSESNSRAFSFDFIPSGMIENILVYKNLSPDMPADFAGGFIKIQTKEMPTQIGFTVGYNIGFNTSSSLQSYRTYSSNAADVFALGAFSRNIPASFPSNLNKVDLATATEQAKQLPNNWAINNRIAAPNQSISLGYSNTKKVKRSNIAHILNFSYGYQEDSYNMSNNMFSIYDIENQESTYLKKFNDTTYTAQAKINLGYNFSAFTPFGKFRFKNLFQNVGTNRTVFRAGEEFVNGYIVKNQEFYYQNRLMYAGQLETTHDIIPKISQINWTLGYGYTNNNEPDRRIMESYMNTDPSSEYFGMYRTMDNYVRRYWQKLTENNVSFRLDYKHDFYWLTFKNYIKAGYYNEFKSRNFDARNFTYKKNNLNNNLPNEYYYYSYEEMFDLQYMRPNGFYLVENTGKSDSYTSSRMINAGFAMANFDFFNVNINGGIRMEAANTKLDSYESDGVKPVNIDNTNIDWFPSINASYTMKEKHVIRAAYAKTINRPEFREIAPYVFYDFEAFSNFEGNPNLLDASIHNIDLRYEFYPEKGETVSIGAFYKKFFNPIEVTYFEVGGQYQYTYMNAHEALSYGVEIDVRKSLDFIKLKHFSLVLNASFIASEVIFPEDELVQQNRPMQGQSPYIINAGLYYDNDKIDLSFSVLYNVLGKRIMAIGQVNQDANQNIPNTYLMPRHSLDAFIQKKIDKVSVSLGAKNILNQKEKYMQFGEYQVGNENTGNYEQTTQLIQSGIQIQVGVSYNF